MSPGILGLALVLRCTLHLLPTCSVAVLSSPPVAYALPVVVSVAFCECVCLLSTRCGPSALPSDSLRVGRHAATGETGHVATVHCVFATVGFAALLPRHLPDCACFRLSSRGPGLPARGHLGGPSLAHVTSSRHRATCAVPICPPCACWLVPWLPWTCQTPV